MYSSYRLSTLIRAVGIKKSITIKRYIEAGYTSVEDISKRFGISVKQAHMFHVIHCNLVEARSSKILGHKNEAYYPTEDIVAPVYNLEDLSKSEKEIAKKDTTTKLWTWEE
jgi:predicted DNA-binding protein